MTTITLTYIFNRSTDVINSCTTQAQLDTALVYCNLLLRKCKVLRSECERKYILAAVDVRREIIKTYEVIAEMKKKAYNNK